MKIVFVTRLHKLDKDRLGFYVPSGVSEYYDLKAGAVDVKMSWKGGGGRNIGVSFSNYKGRLRGVLKDWLMPESGTLVQLTLEVGE